MNDSHNRTAPTYTENAISQLLALHLLQNLGCQYLTPNKALDLRGGKLGGVLLEGVLAPWLRERNRVRFKAKELPFTEGNILSALQALKEIPLDGLVRTNEFGRPGGQVYPYITGTGGRQPWKGMNT